MALALNNLKRVDMPLNKETNPNQRYKEVSLDKNLYIVLLKQFFNAKISSQTPQKF